MVGDYHKVIYCYTRSVSVIGMLLLRSFAPSYIYCHFLLIHSSKYPCLQNLFVPASCGGLVLRAEKGLSRVITNRLTGGPGLCDRRPLFLQARGVCLAYRAVSHLSLNFKLQDRSSPIFESDPACILHGCSILCNVLPRILDPFSN
jgi:hypothetical protein